MRLAVSLVLHILVYGLAYFVFGPTVDAFLSNSEVLTVLVSGGIYVVASLILGLILVAITVPIAVIVGKVLLDKKMFALSSCLGIVILALALIVLDKNVIVAMPNYLDFAPHFSNGQAWVVSLVSTVLGLATGLSGKK